MFSSGLKKLRFDNGTIKGIIVRRHKASSVKAVKGQSLAEYGLVLALVAVVAIAGLTTLGNNMNDMLSGLAAEIKSVPVGGGATPTLAAFPGGSASPAVGDGSAQTANNSSITANDAMPRCEGCDSDGKF